MAVVEDVGPVDRRHFTIYYVGCEANAAVEVAAEMDNSTSRKTSDYPRENSTVRTT